MFTLGLFSSTSALLPVGETFQNKSPASPTQHGRYPVFMDCFTVYTSLLSIIHTLIGMNVMNKPEKQIPDRLATHFDDSLRHLTSFYIE